MEGIPHMPVPPRHRPPCAPRAALLTVLAAVTATATLLGSPTPAHAAAPRKHPVGTDQVPGMDVSRYQGTVDWQGAWAKGARWAYVKATEGTTFESPTFPAQFQGAHDAGMIRGAYHFARPDTSGAAQQATHFLDHGGDWKADGGTLPPALDLEYNPSGPDICYGRGPADLVAWIREFSDTVRARTGRAPVLYTTTDWWTRCTGNDTSFGDTNPLWIARYASTPDPLPAGWHAHTFWQYADSGTFPGDQNRFNGSYDDLKAFANG